MSLFSYLPQKLQRPGLYSDDKIIKSGRRLWHIDINPEAKKYPDWATAVMFPQRPYWKFRGRNESKEDYLLRSIKKGKMYCKQGELLVRMSQFVLIFDEIQAPPSLEGLVGKATISAFKYQDFTHQSLHRLRKKEEIKKPHLIDFKKY